MKQKIIQFDQKQLSNLISCIESFNKLGETTKFTLSLDKDNDYLILLSGTGKNCVRTIKFNLNNYSSNYIKDTNTGLFSSTLNLNKESIKILNFIKKTMKKELLNFILNYDSDSNELRFISLILDSSTHKFNYNISLGYSEYFPIDNQKMLNFLNWENLNIKDLYAELLLNAEHINDLIDSIDIIKTTRAGDDDNVIILSIDNKLLSVKDEKIKSDIIFKNFDIKTFKNESFSIKIKIDDFIKITDCINKFKLLDKNYIKINIYRNTLLLTYQDLYDYNNIDNTILSSVIA